MQNVEAKDEALAKIYGLRKITQKNSKKNYDEFEVDPDGSFDKREVSKIRGIKFRVYLCKFRNN